MGDLVQSGGWLSMRRRGVKMGMGERPRLMVRGCRIPRGKNMMRGCLRWTGKMVERSRIEWGSIAFSSFSFRISVKYQKRAMDLIKVACQNEEVGF